MKHIFILFALISLNVFSSCDAEEMETMHALEFQEEINKPAEVSFTVDNKDLTLFEKDDLLITNNSLNAVSYHWDFGNGDTSSEERPNYEFDIHGYYTITLTITDVLGNTHEASQEILVLCVFGGGPHDF